MKIQYTIDPNIPAELIPKLLKACEFVEQEASSIAPRVSADWEWVPKPSPKIKLVLSDSAGGSMFDLYDPQELESEASMKQKIHRFWGNLLWDTAARQRERVHRMVQEYLAEAE